MSLRAFAPLLQLFLSLQLYLRPHAVPLHNHVAAASLLLLCIVTVLLAVRCAFSSLTTRLDVAAKRFFPASVLHL